MKDGVDGIASQFEGRGLATRGLCGGCKHSTVMRRGSKSELTIRCNMMGEYIPDDINECSSFEEHRRMSIYDMQELAITIDKRIAVNDGSYK